MCFIVVTIKPNVLNNLFVIRVQLAKEIYFFSSCQAVSTKVSFFLSASFFIWVNYVKSSDLLFFLHKFKHLWFYVEFSIAVFRLLRLVIVFPAELFVIMSSCKHSEHHLTFLLLQRKKYEKKTVSSNQWNRRCSHDNAVYSCEWFDVCHSPDWGTHSADDEIISFRFVSFQAKINFILRIF